MPYVTVIPTNVNAALQSIAAIPANVIQYINITEILDRAGAMLLARTRDRYLRQVDPDEIPWLPSKRGLRRRILGSTGTLFDTGRLFHSIQLHTVSQTPEAGERAISTDVPYAGYHQDGARGVMRKFLGFSDVDQQMYNRVVDGLVQRAVQRANSQGVV